MLNYWSTDNAGYSPRHASLHLVLTFTPGLPDWKPGVERQITIEKPLITRLNFWSDDQTFNVKLNLESVNKLSFGKLEMNTFTVRLCSACSQTIANHWKPSRVARTQPLCESIHFEFAKQQFSVQVSPWHTHAQSHRPGQQIQNSSGKHIPDAKLEREAYSWCKSRVGSIFLLQNPSGEHMLLKLQALGALWF